MACGLAGRSGRLTGSLPVSFQGDDNEKAAVVATANASKAVDRLKDRYAGLPAQAIAVDIPSGTITGASPRSRNTAKKPIVAPGAVLVAVDAPDSVDQPLRSMTSGSWLRGSPIRSAARPARRSSMIVPTTSARQPVASSGSPSSTS